MRIVRARPRKLGVLCFLTPRRPLSEFGPFVILLNLFNKSIDGVNGRFSPPFGLRQVLAIDLLVSLSGQAKGVPFRFDLVLFKQRWNLIREWPRLIQRCSKHRWLLDLASKVDSLIHFSSSHFERGLLIVVRMAVAI